MAQGPVVLVANRAEIACRIIKACNALGVPSVAVYSEADQGTLPTKLASRAEYIGAKPACYTSMEKLLEAAKRSNATAIHPGYGFLSESPEFVAAVEAAGLVWLGPRAQTMSDFALKHVAKDMAVAADVPIMPGSPLITSAQDAATVAERIGYPVLLKATGGGGGMGIHKCATSAEVVAAFPLAVSQGLKSFGNGDVFVEKYIESAKHIEVQVFGDGAGHVVALGDRECSVQRRHQKVLEECPSPSLDDALRSEMMAAAVRLCAAAEYRSAGTVEFLLDARTREYYFLEVNTRLQVEHGITELVTGTDIVEMMLRLQLTIPAGRSCDGHEVAASTPESMSQDLQGFQLSMKGHAIEVRLCAEDPCHGLTPASGVLGEVAWPDGVEGLRLDTWVHSGTEVTPFFDSLLAKVMVHADTRAAAIERMSAALAGMRVKGIPTNAQLTQAVLADPSFLGGTYDTHLLLHMPFVPSFAEVLEGGMMTTVQDWPGRAKLWHVGVPPSGPMDPGALRYANALVGNGSAAAGLEITLRGPKLRFHRAAAVAVCGGEFPVTAGGAPVAMWSMFRVEAGDIVEIGAASSGARCYLAVDGGFDAPVYLGSRATFPSGALGGYQGRVLQTGDSCELGSSGGAQATEVSVPAEWQEEHGQAVDGKDHCLWHISMLPGPQAAPDYFLPEDIEVLTGTAYEVHYNSNRLGIRLTGPRPGFAREDGGEGGGHPSNVHDHVYPVGAINFSGDMPIILTADGPSLGGFVCPLTTIEADMWKWGQVRPGDLVHFQLVSLQDALTARVTLNARIDAVAHAARTGEQLDADKVASSVQVPSCEEWPTAAAILKQTPDAIWRLAGDRFVFVEFGDMVLDFRLRARVAELELWLAANAPEGFIESSPGVRSALLEYDPVVLPLPAMLELLEREAAVAPDVSDFKARSRILRLPMAFRERWSQEAMAKYKASVRPDAPYLPDNAPFVAEINALEGGIEELKKIMFEASYMVFGLGDVYLGAPCAVPINPLHRLICPKYNPARTFTWEGTVGLGGAYLCIYPMCSPGGYQLLGRTLPIWNSFGAVAPFNAAKPWLLEIFDQIRFFEVTEDELLRMRSEFVSGTYALEMEEEEFDFGKHAAWCETLADDVAAWKAKQAAAAKVMAVKDAEILARLEALGYKPGGGANNSGEALGGADDGAAQYEGDQFSKAVAPFAACVWEVSCVAGDAVRRGQQVCVLEAMKVETPVLAEADGTVVAVVVEKGRMVSRGQPLVILEAVA